MKDLKSSLVREKFVLHDPNTEKQKSAPVIAVSNRYVLELSTQRSGKPEIFVVRAQNMHSCLRFSARLLQSFRLGGSILHRGTPFDWEAAWTSIANSYERAFNPQLWVAVYSRGQLVFSKGEHHPFLDVIEKCDYTNPDEYDFSVPLAERAFLETGKVVEIEHDSNIALVTTLSDDQARCGIILRGPNSTKTFTFTAYANPQEGFNPAQAMTIGASFLEGIQLAFMVGMNGEKIRIGQIERFSDEDKKTQEARQRIKHLAKEIRNFEELYDVRYRPEKPEFRTIHTEAKLLAKEILAGQDDEWVV